MEHVHQRLHHFVNPDALRRVRVHGEDEMGVRCPKNEPPITVWGLLPQNDPQESIRRVAIDRLYNTALIHTSPIYDVPRFDPEAVAEILPDGSPPPVSVEALVAIGTTGHRASDDGGELPVTRSEGRAIMRVAEEAVREGLVPLVP
jgi:hypothetical protein